MANIAIVTFGTRGDVQPYIPLGCGLQQAGHHVRIVTHPLFEDFITGHGLELAPVHAVDPREGFGQRVSDIGGNPARMLSWMKQQYDRVLRAAVPDLLNALQGADLVISSILSFIAYHVAEKSSIPAIGAYLQPVNPTRAFCGPSADLPQWLPFKGTLSWLSFKSSNYLFFEMLRGSINDIRQQMLGLPTLTRRYFYNIDTSPMPILYGYSPSVLPKPNDWDEQKHVVGYWFLDDRGSWQPPPDLLTFLNAGDPPVYIGFGSMIEDDFDQVTEIVLSALERAKQRGILLGGWGGLGASDLPDTVLRVDYAPHDWLFPKVAATVHHGGAGTTAESLRAGIPTVVVPFFADQPFWGRRVHALGVGPVPIPRRKLTVERLATAINEAVSSEQILAQAAKLGEQIQRENGVERSVTVVNDLLCHPELLKA